MLARVNVNVDVIAAKQKQKIQQQILAVENRSTKYACIEVPGSGCKNCHALFG